MGLFGKIFEKKTCAFCGGEIGMLGNRKLEDGNMCKKCAAKLSPWFSDRRRSTVDTIGKQLEYREANKEAVAKFKPTLTFGTDTKVYLDEDDRKFVVTRANPNRFSEENPDVIDFSQVTGVDIDIDEDTTEDMREDKEGNEISYNPPRFFYSYDFNIIIRVNSPYFDEIKFRLNSSDVETNPENSVPANMKPYPEMNQDYAEYKKMGEDIKNALTSARQQVRDEAAAARVPKQAVVCQCCGASTIPDDNGRCEYCGGAAV
ncbi:MAG: DUF4428 domain-containing protein [Ruminococcus sp.]|nr:DUF4428 domain-containing protein [Ruminococcus sp.]